MKTHREHQKLRAYFQNIPWMLNYQIVSTLILFAIFEFVHWISMVLIYSTGRVAVTNSDYKFVVTTWQGWIFFIVFLVSVFFSVAFNINGIVILADKAIKNEPISILKALKDREHSIADALNSAEKARKEVAGLKAANDQILTEARREKDIILKEARDIKDKIIADAKLQANTEAQKSIEYAKQQIEAEKAAAINDIKKQVAELSLAIAEKVIKKQVEKSQDQEALIQDMLKDLKLN